MTEKKKVSVSMDDLTWEEMEIFEDATGLVMSDAVKTEIVRDKNGRPVPDPDDPRGHPLKQVKMTSRALSGMIYVALLRDNPDLTYDEVKKMKVSDIDFEMIEEAKFSDPTGATEETSQDSETKE